MRRAESIVGNSFSSTGFERLFNYNVLRPTSQQVNLYISVVTVVHRTISREKSILLFQISLVDEQLMDNILFRE